MSSPAPRSVRRSADDMGPPERRGPRGLALLAPVSALCLAGLAAALWPQRAKALPPAAGVRALFEEPQPLFDAVTGAQAAGKEPGQCSGTPGFPVRGVLYTPHMVGEPYPWPQGNPQDVYDELYAAFHERDLPLIKTHLSADTLLLRPWTLGDGTPKELVRRMHDERICQYIPTFHLSKYYAELLQEGGMDPDTSMNAALFKDFVRFAQTLEEVDNKSAKAIGWSVDLSLDLESLMRHPLDETCEPRPNTDKNYLRYKNFLEILVKWVRGGIAPTLSKLPLLLPLDISRYPAVRKAEDTLKLLVHCMPTWLETVFRESGANSTKWLWTFSLPYQAENSAEHIAAFFEHQLSVLATRPEKAEKAVKYTNLRAVVMVGAQAVWPNPVNVANEVEDYGTNATPAVQQLILQKVFEKYSHMEQGGSDVKFEGFLVDEWQDDWDRAGRGPAFLALDSADAMRQTCDTGGRFSHDHRGCSRAVGGSDQPAFPEYFGLVSSHSSMMKHCMRPRFFNGGGFSFNTSFLASAEPIPMHCRVLPSLLWIEVSGAISVLFGIMIIFSGGLCCRGGEAVDKSPPAEEEEQDEVTVRLPMEPKEAMLRGGHVLELKSTRFKNSKEATWWLSAHLSSQVGILEKQVMAEFSATKALAFRTNFMHPAADSDATTSSESEGDEPRRRASLARGARGPGSDAADLRTAMASVHKRVLEGFAAWCIYVAKAPLRCPRSVEREKLKEFAELINNENEDREAPLLFAEALLLRTMESLGEQILHCPERLAFLLYKVLVEAGGPLQGAQGRSLLFSVDFEELQAGLREMNQHSNPYELKLMSSGRYKRGMNFDDINECGIQCREDLAKTYKEPASIMVMVDFFLCYRAPFMIKVWGLFIAAYIYLGSDSDPDTSNNGSFFEPKWLRLNFLQYTALLDAGLWTGIEMLLICYVLWQRGPSLGHRTPGVPDCFWFLEHVGDLVVSGASFCAIVTHSHFVRKPVNCSSTDVDARNGSELLMYMSMYWGTRLVVFVLLHQKHMPILINGSPFKKLRHDTGRTCREYIKNEAVVDLAWVSMLALCILVEVKMLLPAMKGLNWSSTCGFDVLGDVLGFPKNPTGACSQEDHWFGFDCTSCIFSVVLAALLLLFMVMVDIYFIFYAVSSIFGTIMGHQRHLNDLKNTSVLVDLDPNKGREAKRFEYTFGPQWRLVWMLMVQNLWEEAYIGPREFESLVEAAGLTVDGEQLEDTKRRKPIYLARYPRLAAERLAFFFHSLKWIESPNMRNFKFESDTDSLTGPFFDPGTVPSLTQIIPAFNETVIHTSEFLRSGSLPEDAMNQSREGLDGDMTEPPLGSGVNTNLAFIISQYPDEWTYLTKRLQREGQLKDPSAHQLYRNFMNHRVSEDVELEIRLWAALRSQTVYKTVIGALQYARALAALPAIRKEYAKNPSKRVPEDHVEVILAHQTFGQKPEADEQVRLLLMRNSQYPLSLVFDLTKNSSESIKRLVRAFVYQKSGHDGSSFEEAGVKARWDTNLRDLRIIEVLPRKFGLRLGQGEYKTQGKAGNQLNGLRFASGHYLQALDCNMGAYIGEGFKVPYVLRTFMPLDIDTRVGTQCRYLGFREYIYTGREGTVGKCHASAEWTFGTIYQRFLSGLGARMHYGHPDFVDGFWARNRGGMSKSSAVVNLSEDIFAGYNVRMREERSPHVDVLEFEKGREASFNAASNFFCKISMGSVAVLRSRDNHLLCERIGIVHSLSFYFTSVAFYTSNLIIDIATYLYVFLFIFFTLANIDLARLKLLGSSFGTEWLVSMGIVSIIPQLFEMVLEFGAIRAIKDVLGGFFASTWFFIFQNKAIASAMRNGAATGIARYLSTGRPMANQHQTWKDAYISYHKSHYEPACSLLMAYLIYILLVFNTFQGKLPMVLIIISFVAWFITPMVFSPFPRIKLIKQDLVDFNGFINGRAGMAVEDIGDVIQRGASCKVRTLFECGLSDEIATWSDHPVTVLGLYIVIRVVLASLVLLALPSEITDFMWIYALILCLQWVFVWGFFQLDLNNILLIMSFLVWGSAFGIGYYILGKRAFAPSILVRLPEYILSFLIFLYLMGLAKQCVLLACRFLFVMRRWCCPSFENQAKDRLRQAIRLAYVYFFVHQLHCVQAYFVLIVNLVTSILLAGVDMLPCQPHTWWLLNTELARTKRQEQYLDKAPAFLDLDDQRTGFSSESSSDAGSDVSSDTDSVDGPVSRRLVDGRLS